MTIRTSLNRSELTDLFFGDQDLIKIEQHHGCVAYLAGSAWYTCHVPDLCHCGFQPRFSFATFPVGSNKVTKSRGLLCFKKQIAFMAHGKFVRRHPQHLVSHAHQVDLHCEHDQSPRSAEAEPPESAHARGSVQHQRRTRALPFSNPSRQRAPHRIPDLPDLRARPPVLRSRVCCTHRRSISRSAGTGPSACSFLIARGSGAPPRQNLCASCSHSRQSLSMQDALDLDAHRCEKLRSALRCRRQVQEYAVPFVLSPASVRRLPTSSSLRHRPLRTLSREGTV